VLTGKLEVVTPMWLFKFAALNMRKLVKEGFAGNKDMTIDV
jgi:hypothetical protein